MSQTITHGEFGYRTAAMEPETARAFARCLSANASRFMNVELFPSKQSRTPKLFVRFQPRNTERLEAIRQEQQEARADRALEQPFLFWVDPDRRAVIWCYSVQSRETYQVTAADCSCPDFEYRCKHTGMKCKHMIARALWSTQTRAAMIAQDF